MSIADSPLLTLLIPSRERAETLRHTLRTALDQDSPSYEVIVSDNLSHDETPTLLSSFSDTRLQKLRTDRHLSMCDHWEFALRHAHGKYIVFIGDDDAVLPRGIERLTELIRRRPSPAYFWKPPVYAWPMDGNPAWIRFIPRPSREVEIPLRPLIRRVIRYGGWNYAKLPCVYHSAVSRDILEAIRAKTGRVFHSTQPDIFTSMAVPAFAASHVRSARPFTLHGISAKSNGAAAIAQDGTAMVTRFIKEYGDYPLHPTLYPEIRAFANLVVDAILVAMDLFPDYYRGMRFNYDAMWAFLYKIGGGGKLEILRKAREIRRYHRFSIPRFLCYLGLQEGIVRAKQAATRLLSMHPLSRDLPENIGEFARAYSRFTD